MSTLSFTTYTSIMNKYAFPTKQEIIEASKRIKDSITPSPVWTNTNLDTLTQAKLYFKMESLIPEVHAFKIRGALNAVLSLSDEQRAKGVVTHSSGNHGKALAYAARQLNIPAYVVVPSNAPEIKRKGIEAQGVQIIDCLPTQQAREETSQKVITQTGATFIHPYNDYSVIAGQATAAKELIEEIPDLDIIIAPVGGGGLLSGTALSAHYFSQHTKVIGAEPEIANDAYRSLTSGILQKNEDFTTIADGLRLSLGDKTFPIVQKYVDHIIQVTEDDIRSALSQLWREMKTPIEPSSAVAFAGAFKNSEDFYNKKVGIIITGGNVKMEDFI